MKIWQTELSLNSRILLWCAVSALVVASLLGVMLPAFAQQGYETAPVLSASKILPPELLSGPNHRVQERVTMSMKNQNGVTIVILKNEGQESGTQLSVGPAGIKITMK